MRSALCAELTSWLSGLRKSDLSTPVNIEHVDSIAPHPIPPEGRVLIS